MIIAYTGLPGGGKSLSALQDYVLPQLRKERHVFCNIVGLDPMRIAARLNVTTSEVNRYLHCFSLSFNDDIARDEKRFCTLNEDGSMYYATAEGLEYLICDVMVYREAVLVLDECHEYLAPENWKVLRSFHRYMSMARHYGHDVVLITQHITDIWEPLRHRVHETHNFTRGMLGFKTHYKESVYHGWNVFLESGYSKSRLNDKSLYSLYSSHDGGAKERIGYSSIWRNKKLVAGFLFVFLCFSFAGYSLLTRGLFGNASKGVKSSVPAPELSRNDNVVYVKYVVCGSFDCKATRPDGTVLTLPLDYASGRYPIEIRRFDAQSNNSFIGLSGSGARPK
jgi:zona occludens toxin